MMRPWRIWASLAVVLALAGIAAAWIFLGRKPVDERVAVPLAFSDIDGWEGDDHGQAFAAFHRSCERILQVAAARAGIGNGKPHPLTQVCREALALGEAPGRDEARAFFEDHFTPTRYNTDESNGPAGFVTGYYEPELDGSRTRTDRFTVPVYAVPDDLVRLHPDSERAKRNAEITAGRETPDGMAPYYDRKEIEQGALEGRGLELVWLESPVEAFFMHVQGSARIALGGGGRVRLGFAAKNGHPYTSIGRVLIERGTLDRETMTAGSVKSWLAANPEEGRKVMWENRSYIFFRELPEEDAALGPVGAQGVALTPQRSLAVDTSIHALGTPVWVDAPGLDANGQQGFHRLMIAQDTGSAIRGRERGDIFWGSGGAAGEIAGRTRHKAAFTLLLPKGGTPGS